MYKKKWKSRIVEEEQPAWPHQEEEEGGFNNDLSCKSRIVWWWSAEGARRPLRPANFYREQSEGQGVVFLFLLLRSSSHREHHSCVFV